MLNRGYVRVKLGLWVSVDGHVLVIFQAGLRVYDSGLGLSTWVYGLGFRSLRGVADLRNEG